MLELEKQNITNFVADMNEEERSLVLNQLDTDILIKELARRNRLQTKKLTAIELIINAK